MAAPWNCCRSNWTDGSGGDWLGAGFGGCTAIAGGGAESTLTSAGGDRSPTPTPLVISLHAGATWPAHQRNLTRWDRLADEEGFIVVYPAGNDLEGVPGASLIASKLWHTFDPGPGLDRDALHEGRDLAITTDTGGMVVYVDVFSLSHPDTGTSLGTAWIAQDVTDLRATEAALREANSDLKQFKALVEASPDFIAIANPDGNVKYVNPGGRQMLEMDPDVDPTTTSIPEYVTPEVFALYLEVVQPVVMEHGHWAGEASLLSHRGKVIPVALATFLVREHETGEPFALATVQRDITERIAAETALRELADQRQALLTRLVDAQDAERAQIAADVHDDPVQALAAVDLRLGLLSRRLGEHAPALLETLGNVQASVAGATDRLRTLLFDLEPPDLEHGLTGALHRAADEIFDSTPTRWVVDGDREPDVPDATRAIAYRIAKEAMMNARKHAKADNVVVTVAGRDHGLEVCVSDDGVGLGPHPIQTTPGHRGLFTMQDRAEIAAERQEAVSEKGRSEFHYGSFARRVTLPKGAREDQLRRARLGLARGRGGHRDRDRRLCGNAVGPGGGGCAGRLPAPWPCRADSANRQVL